ncbi:MAG: O-antigen ligase family protein [Candidatus Electronema sp. V4]|uniref:O-antigen ligase family protein n=1 Tax=Candidatus Electronema sp. V4 TaxID=3454756 RepID=UPI0040553AB4
MVFVVFLAVLFFAPLAFGTTETWSRITAELLVALTALLYFAPLPAARKTAFYQVPGLLPLLLFVAWIFFQCVPLPPQAVRLLSPQTAAAYQPAFDLRQAEFWLPLTVNRQATLLEGLRFAAYALFYLLTVQLLVSSRRLSTVLTSIVWLTLFIAFAAMLQRALSPDTLFWFKKLRAGLTTFGPWVYKNQYAGFMVMTCPLVLALFLFHRPVADENASFRERLLHLFSGSGANLHLGFGFGVIVVLASVLLAQSRGGILSLLFALSLFFLLMARSQKKIQTLTLLCLICGLLLAGGWFSWDAVLARFDQAFDLTEGQLKDGRLPIWQDTVKIIPDFLLIGTGFGTFIEVFPGYKSFADSLIYDHAHNDYLELLTDGGLIGFLLAAWFVLAVLRSGWRQIFRRHDRLAVLATLGAFSGLAGLLFFSITDFNLHNWANGLYFFFLCGLLVSAGHTRQQYRNRPTLLTPAAAPARARLAAFLGAAVFLIALLRLQGGNVLAERHYLRAQSVADSAAIEPERQLERMTELLEQAVKYAPFHAGYRYALGNIRQYQQRNASALILHSEALLRQPLEGVYLQAAGLVLEETGSDPQLARALLERGYAWAKLKEGPLRVWVEFELAAGRRNSAMRILTQELARDPRLLESIYPLLTEQSFTREEMAAVLPKLTSSWLHCANLTRAAGNKEDADYFTERAMDFLDQEAKPQSYHFLQVYQYHWEQKQEEQAVETLREGIKRLPDYAPFHIYLGDYYSSKTIDYRAIEEYKQALLIQPNDADVQKKLKQLKDKLVQP